MKKHKKIVAIFIAYQAAKTLESFYQKFPKNLFDDIILVDDASSDNTFEIAKKLKIKSYKNPKNLGYGGNMKRALDLALEDGADIIVDLHPDNEYLPTAIAPALKKITNQNYEFILGNRFVSFSEPLNHGMYLWKLLPIFLLNKLDKIILEVPIDDLHQGFRVYTKSMLSKINFHSNSNNYLFSFELIAQAAFKKIKIGQVPVETNYTGKKRGANIKNSFIYSLGTFKILFFYLLAKARLKSNLFSD